MKSQEIMVLSRKYKDLVEKRLTSTQIDTCTSIIEDVVSICLGIPRVNVSDESIMQCQGVLIERLFKNFDIVISNIEAMKIQAMIFEKLYKKDFVFFVPVVAEPFTDAKIISITMAIGWIVVYEIVTFRNDQIVFWPDSNMKSVVDSQKVLANIHDELL